jgi:hypothetical protein
MMHSIGNFFSGMIDMSPRAVEARRLHVICEGARAEARAKYVTANQHAPCLKQMALDADMVGQKAYWVKMRQITKS